MSMKFENIVERCPMTTNKQLPKQSVRKCRVTVVRAIYILYFLQAATIAALIVLWMKVFFYMKG